MFNDPQPSSVEPQDMVVEEVEVEVEVVEEVEEKEGAEVVRVVRLHLSRRASK